MIVIEKDLVKGASYLPSPNHGGALASPSLLIMHYTASGGTAEDDQKYFATPAAQAAAHVIVGRDGLIYQSVNFATVAWHAGVSTWRGRSGCNGYAIGVEVDNWGLLQQRADGGFYSWSGAKIPADRVLHARNKLGVDGYWETYPEAQLTVLDDLTHAILAAYPSIKEVAGHEDVSPGRKTDPGPAFPLQRYENMVTGRQGAPTSATRAASVTASALNVRTGPGTNFDVIEQLNFGAQVEILYDGAGWAQISHQQGKTGWVADQFLKPVAP